MEPFDDRARRGTGGRRLRLRCGGPRVARTALRGSLRGAAAMPSAPAPGRGRPIKASRRSGATRRTAPAALRCSAPQRRRKRHPPAPLREPAAQLATVRRVALSRLVALALRRAAQWCLQGRGRASGGAPLRRRAAQRSGVGAVPRDDFDVSEALYPGPSCRSRPAERAPEGSRPEGTTAAAKRSRSPAHGLARSASRVGRRQSKRATN